MGARHHYRILTKRIQHNDLAVNVHKAGPPTPSWWELNLSLAKRAAA
jgi:hypothetical protein